MGISWGYFREISWRYHGDVNEVFNFSLFFLFFWFFCKCLAYFFGHCWPVDVKICCHNGCCVLPYPRSSPLWDSIPQWSADDFWSSQWDPLGESIGNTGNTLGDFSGVLKSMRPEARRSFLLQKIFASDAWSGLEETVVVMHSLGPGSDDKWCLLSFQKKWGIQCKQ